jgi:hypothetical protein
MPAWYGLPLFSNQGAFLWTPQNTTLHSGYDLNAPCGTPVTAPIDGQVLNSGPQPWGGQVDILAHGVPGYPDPVVLTWLHFSREDVRAGQQVHQGEQLGVSGQPPPGGQYGGGCHIHFEMSAGDKAPYTPAYSPHNPTASSHPLSPTPFLNWVNTGATGQNPVQEALASIDPFSQFAAGILNPASIGSKPSGITAFGAALAPSFGWIKAPLRIIKLGMGMLMIISALVLAFLPDAAEAAVSVAGFPELAPVVGGAASKLQGPKLRFAPTIRSANAALAAQEEKQARQQRQQTVRGVGVRVRTQRAQNAAANSKANPKGALPPMRPRDVPPPLGFPPLRIELGPRSKAAITQDSKASMDKLVAQQNTRVERGFRRFLRQSGRVEKPPSGRIQRTLKAEEATSQLRKSGESLRAFRAGGMTGGPPVPYETQLKAEQKARGQNVAPPTPVPPNPRMMKPAKYAYRKRTGEFYNRGRS